MRVFIINLWQTKGVIEKDAKLERGDSISYRDPGSFPTWVPKNYWFEKKEDAILAAEKLKTKKILSIEKQLNKIKSIKF